VGGGEGGSGPQPASAAMDESTARWYVQYTGGQFGMYPVGDGTFYLFLPADDPTRSDAPPGESS
jgi:hypothetical protein